MMFSYLKDLQLNNDKAWFSSHKPAYELAKDEARTLFESIYAELKKELRLEPLKIYRIYRDVRFSKDKTPYKTNFSAYTAYKKPEQRGGLYIQIAPANSFIAAGFWGPNPTDLLRIRKEIAASDELEQLLSAQSIQQEFAALKGDEVKTAPRGFDKDHPRIALLRKKQFILVKKFTDEAVLAPDFPLRVRDSLDVLKPFFDYMTSVLTTDENGESLF